MVSQQFFDIVSEKVNIIMNNEKENIQSAAQVIADSIMSGGIIQSFGSGHSYAGAIEIAGRAGGLIPAKVIEDPTRGELEIVEGSGKALMRRVQLEKNDVVVIISNSGRNPMPLEIAEIAKAKGVKIIAVTALEISKKTTSRHSSGKRLFEFADVVLNNHSVDGDCAITMEGLDVPVGPTSSIACSLLLNAAILEAYEIMISKGYKVPVFKSANVDGGREFNKTLLEKYAHRIYRL
ncbi:SIS domain-containing protein [uncultured Clostridium sp.]|uniref:SIS domain-containing protein n=1 Tax=uncultured Clostridium sp. TaxID=59620 RepID=UPI00261BA8BE|nr:SIS domain-containing protein [uncultured Clostridium sp.]